LNCRQHQIKEQGKHFSSNNGQTNQDHLKDKGCSSSSIQDWHDKNTLQWPMIHSSHEGSTGTYTTGLAPSTGERSQTIHSMEEA
jgi:hypothetical protein